MLSKQDGDKIFRYAETCLKVEQARNELEDAILAQRSAHSSLPLISEPQTVIMEDGNTVCTLTRGEGYIFTYTFSKLVGS